jgi:hypothetical protein
LRRWLRIRIESSSTKTVCLRIINRHHRRSVSLPIRMPATITNEVTFRLQDWECNNSL